MGSGLLLTKLVGLLLVLLCTNSSAGQGPIGSPGGRSLREPMDRSIGHRVHAPVTIGSGPNRSLSLSLPCTPPSVSSCGRGSAESDASLDDVVCPSIGLAQCVLCLFVVYPLLCAIVCL